MPDKLIINAALTGMVPTKADNRALPVTPAEIAADARRCVAAGASILHLHARDADGRPTPRADIYREILERVRDACPDAILCVSTSGRIHRTFEERAAVLDLPTHANRARPEMASLTLGSMNFARDASINAPDMIHALAKRMQERNILPELEVFEPGMAEYARYLLKHNLLPAHRPLYINILLGSRGTLSASPTNFAFMLECLPPNAIWAATGIGRFQFDIQRLAIESGGHVRTGLEDALFMDPEKRDPATNPRLIERVAAHARTLGRNIASSAETRTLLQLPPPA